MFAEILLKYIAIQVQPSRKKDKRCFFLKIKHSVYKMLRQKMVGFG